MSKKIILISSLVVVAAVAVLGGAYALGTNHPTQEKTSHVEKKASSSSKKTDGDNASTKDADKVQSSAFSALPQKVQVALLAYNELPTNYGTPLKTHYSVYMGDKDKIVIYDDGEGAGGFAEHTDMFTDNHNGTYDLSFIESSSTDMAGVTASNSYWKKSKTITEDEMMQNYQDHKDEINFSANELVDLSKSSDEFTLVPTNQVTPQ
ncbi:hypothetical protein G6R29_03500 [Fructobacillus sp. M2-14]|uniref:Lipoprotein n=1 Tax=Fructobacillus broussonetiae TaxID=2713173 RepID=A0ABS5QZU4_9LACO|nr:hypothetical protein [Fructobacillus broussonetiae]MBS9338694.1 hypothetical protein [Fructobacillus broussonetiae]